ncbi:GSCOCG00008010001-RA-CDS [Cotesia congregata]|nr:GSCOCG00008010001-RA-CDS [Cotesia congregata]
MFFQGVAGPRPVGGRGARDARREQEGNPEAERNLQQDQAGQDGRIRTATRIQKLYRENRRKAMQEILNEPSPFCQVPKDEVDRYFRTMYSDDSPLDADLPERQVWPPDETGEMAAALVAPRTETEVSRRLARMQDTAPGPDGLKYGDLKRTDRGCVLLTAVYNACMRLGAVPASWKVSNTVLIHKKGDRNDLSNWRPLAMGNTIYKLFAALIADRITSFVVAGQRLTPSQKGFLHYEGCLEHNYVVQEILEDGARQGKDVIVACLDASNAFGSIPHAVIFDAFEGIGAPEPIQNLIKGYMLNGKRIASCAYADDYCFTASSEEDMVQLLLTASVAVRRVGIKFNPSKCVTLHVTGKGSKRKVKDTKFYLGGEEMRSLGEGESCDYLGVPTGFRINQTPMNTLTEMMTDARSIDSSLLAPWQKIDALRSFIIPRLDYILRGGKVDKTPLTTVDKGLRRMVKGWLHLPQRASAEVVYAQPWRGGCGIIPLADLADILAIAQAFRMLSCKDPDVAEIAKSSLEQVVQRKTIHHPSPQEIAEFLSGSLDGPFAGNKPGDPNIWTRVRIVTRRLSKKLGVRWKWDEVETGFALEMKDTGDRIVTVPPSARSQIIWRLRKAAQNQYLEMLTAKKDQGKVWEVTSRNRESNLCLRDGKYIRFAEWRFIHRARLDVLPLNGAIRWGERDKRCRVCGYHLESLLHVLNHCMTHSAGYQLRHDAILKRIAEASRIAGEKRVNKTVQGVDGDLAALRPDLVVRNEQAKSIVIVDVIVTFENQCKALDAARKEKCEKYRELATALREQGYQVTVDAIVVGSLGAWDPNNEPVLRKLGITQYYARLMR